MIWLLQQIMAHLGLTIKKRNFFKQTHRLCFVEGHVIKSSSKTVAELMITFCNSKFQYCLDQMLVADMMFSHRQVHHLKSSDYLILLVSDACQALWGMSGWRISMRFVVYYHLTIQCKSNDFDIICRLSSGELRSWELRVLPWSKKNFQF